MAVRRTKATSLQTGAIEYRKKIAPMDAGGCFLRGSLSSNTRLRLVLHMFIVNIVRSCSRAANVRSAVSSDELFVVFIGAASLVGRWG